MGGRRITTASIERAAWIIDDDFRARRCEGQRVGPSQATARTRDDADPLVQRNHAAGYLLDRPQVKGGRVEAGAVVGSCRDVLDDERKGQIGPAG